MSEIIKMSPSVYVVDGTSVSWGTREDQRLCSCAEFKAARACDHLNALAAHLGVEAPSRKDDGKANLLDTEVIRFQNAYVKTLQEAANGKV